MVTLTITLTLTLTITLTLTLTISTLTNASLVPDTKCDNGVTTPTGPVYSYSGSLTLLLLGMTASELAELSTANIAIVMSEAQRWGVGGYCSSPD